MSSSPSRTTPEELRNKTSAPRRELLYRTLLVLGSLLASLFLIEAAGRLTGLFPKPSKTYRFSATKGYDLSPGEGDVNSAGFRDREYPVAKPPGTFRIVAIGDSFTFGHGVGRDETYSERLEGLLGERLGSKGLRFEVLNAGVPGYNTYQELIRLREDVLKFDPDLILVGFTLSDADLGEFGMKDPRQGALVQRVKEWTKANLGLYEFLRPRLKRLVDRVQTARLDPGNTGGSAIIPLKLAVKGEKSDGWDLCQKSLQELGALAHDHNFRVLVAVFPLLDQLDDRYPFKAEHSLVIRTARENGLVALDLLPAFTGLEPSTLWVKPTDGHPNARGHWIAAEAIYGAILSDGLIPSGGGIAGHSN